MRHLQVNISKPKTVHLCRPSDGAAIENKKGDTFTMKHKKLASLVLACAMVLGLAGITPVQAANTTSTTVSLTVASAPYTITIPTALTVSKTGWNPIDTGIKAEGSSFPENSKLTVSATSQHSWNLYLDATHQIGYTLKAAESDTSATTSWEFTSTEVHSGKTVTAGIAVNDYSNAAPGTYQDVVTFTATVTDLTVAVTGVSLNKTSTTLTVGGEETLTATVAPADATNKAVTWASDNTSVATVDSNGKVTAVAAGTANITVTTTDGSKTATCAVTVNALEAVATPTFSPAAGSYTGTQSVTISCATDGATIHYTTDGTDPTTSSETYTTAITVSETATIKAIAVKNGMANSAVASAAYTITPASYTLSVTAPTFDAVDAGYSQPAAAAITIKSTGNSDATISSVALSGTNPSSFTLTNGTASVTAGGTNTSYTIQPNASLAAGTYTATITVTYNNNATATADVSFTVNAAATTRTVTFNTSTDGTSINKDGVTCSKSFDGYNNLFSMGSGFSVSSGQFTKIVVTASDASMTGKDDYYNDIEGWSTNYSDTATWTGKSSTVPFGTIMGNENPVTIVFTIEE